MIKSLVTGMIVAFQIYLISSIGAKDSTLLLMILILAAIPFVKEPLVRALEEREKELGKRRQQAGRETV